MVQQCCTRSCFIARRVIASATMESARDPPPALPRSLHPAHDSLEAYCAALCDFAESPECRFLADNSTTAFFEQDFAALAPAWRQFFMRDTAALPVSCMVALLRGDFDSAVPGGVSHDVRNVLERAWRLCMPRECAASHALPAALTYGMNVKKRVEVGNMAHAVAEVARMAGATHACDIGSGQV